MKVVDFAFYHLFYPCFFISSHRRLYSLTLVSILLCFPVPFYEDEFIINAFRDIMNL